MEKCEALSTKPEECHYSFFQHTACEFFPCHETAHPEDFNCLFCYCPLYALGDRCGGNFRYIGDGIKADSYTHLEPTRPLSIWYAVF